MKLLDISLEKITGPFEGGSYENVTGNFDGMGVSAGVLQWCFGQGSLQNKILKPFIARHGSIDNLNIFPIKGMDACAKMSDSQGIKFAKEVMNKKSGIIKTTYSLRTEWKLAWQKFLTRPEVINIQKEACEHLADQARDLAYSWGFKSNIAFYWFFDLLVQNGSLKGLQKPTYDLDEVKRLIQKVDSSCRKEWGKLDLRTLTHEQVILFIASHRRASMSRAAYVNDVFARKGSIALGCGVVHGRKLDFSLVYASETMDHV